MAEKNYFREAIELHKKGYTAMNFGLINEKERYIAMKIKDNNERTWTHLDKRVWYALQALDKDPKRVVDGK